MARSEQGTLQLGRVLGWGAEGLWAGTGGQGAIPLVTGLVLDVGVVGARLLVLTPDRLLLLDGNDVEIGSVPNPGTKQLEIKGSAVVLRTGNGRVVYDAGSAKGLARVGESPIGPTQIGRWQPGARSSGVHTARGWAASVDQGKSGMTLQVHQWIDVMSL